MNTVILRELGNNNRKEYTLKNTEEAKSKVIEGVKNGWCVEASIDGVDIDVVYFISDDSWNICYGPSANKDVWEADEDYDNLDGAIECVEYALGI